jgi:hypothetical protein
VVLSHASLRSDAGGVAYSSSGQGVGRAREMLSACNGTVSLCLYDCSEIAVLRQAVLAAVARLSWLCTCCAWSRPGVFGLLGPPAQSVGHSGAAYAVPFVLQKFSALQ